MNRVTVVRNWVVAAPETTAVSAKTYSPSAAGLRTARGENTTADAAAPPDADAASQDPTWEGGRAGDFELEDWAAGARWTRAPGPCIPPPRPTTPLQSPRTPLGRALTAVASTFSDMHRTAAM